MTSEPLAEPVVESAPQPQPLACEVIGASCDVGGRTIVHQVDLSISYGEVVALVGPNGAGKSTLLAMLAGDLAPAEGTVRIAGRTVNEYPSAELARQRSVLLQSNQVSFGFSVRAVIELGRAPWHARASSTADAVAVAAAFAATDTEGLADRAFPQLSGGEKARVSLARVLAQDTPIVLLDEPTAALDLRHAETVLRLARKLAMHRRAVVIVLHDLSLAAAYADRVGIIDQGRLLAVGPPGDVLTPQRLKSVYGLDIQVFPAPDGHTVYQPSRDSPTGPSTVGADR